MSTSEATPRSRILPPPMPEILTRRIGGAKRIDDIGAERIAGVFRRDEEDVAHASSAAVKP